ncbi:hypothetical protein NH462_22765, partial [Pseudoalteromonas sp. OANN1]|nr:hypothetical protein [Pseudoalteromonas sp. OANN1]
AALAVLRKLGKGDPVKYLRDINWQDLGKQSATEVKNIVKGLRDSLDEMSTSWHYDLLLPDAAIEGMQATVKRLDDVTPKIDQHMQQAAQEIGQRVNKALDEYQGQSPIRGVTDKPTKAKADELEPPKGNELPGANKTLIVDELLINGKVPSTRRGEFNKWFDSLTPEQFEILWENKDIRDTIEARIRRPGGYHEWYMVARTPKFKAWGINMDEIKRFRSEINELKWVSPIDGRSGMHGKSGSGTFHKELLELIDNSKNLSTFNTRLDVLIKRWKIDPTIIPHKLTKEIK